MNKAHTEFFKLLRPYNFDTPTDLSNYFIEHVDSYKTQKDNTSLRSSFSSILKGKRMFSPRIISALKSATRYDPLVIDYINEHNAKVFVSKRTSNSFSSNDARLEAMLDFKTNNRL